MFLALLEARGLVLDAGARERRSYRSTSKQISATLDRNPHTVRKYLAELVREDWVRRTGRSRHAWYGTAFTFAGVDYERGQLEIPITVDPSGAINHDEVDPSGAIKGINQVDPSGAINNLPSPQLSRSNPPSTPFVVDLAGRRQAGGLIRSIQKAWDNHHRGRLSPALIYDAICRVRAHTEYRRDTPATDEEIRVYFEEQATNASIHSDQKVRSPLMVAASDVRWLDWLDERRERRRRIEETTTTTEDEKGIPAPETVTAWLRANR